MTSFLAIFGLVKVLQAEAPIVTDRPDFTESSMVVPLGSTQVESGFTFVRADRRNEAFNAPEILVRHSLGAKTELRVGLPNYNWIKTDDSRTEGPDDTYLGAKIQLGPCKGIDLALIPAVFIPTGRKGIRSEAWSPELKFVYSLGLPNDLSLSGMVYVASVEEEGDRVTPLQHTVSLGIPIRDKVGMFVEHVLDVQKNSRPAHLLHSGFTYQPKADRQFDLHYGIGLNRNAPDFFIGAGFSIRF